MRTIGAALLFCLTPAAAMAAAEQPSLSSTVDPTAVLPPGRNASTPLQTPQVDRTPPPASAAELQPQFTLTDVQFDGATAVSPASLAPAWSAFSGKPVTLADLRTIARRAEALYAAAGYPFVAIVVTPQTVEGGVVHLRVVEGRISNLTVLSKDPSARRQATAAFSGLVDHTPLSLKDVQSAYQGAKAIPGLTLAGALRRGSEPGGMDLVIQAKRETWRTYANLNNLYPDTVGPWGLLGGIDHFGNSTWGDQTSLQGYTSLSSGRQEVIRLSHLQRLNAAGTTISAMGLAAWASPQGAVSSLDIATNVLAARLAISHPLVDTPQFSLVGEGALELNNQKTKVFTSVGLSDDRLRILSASLAADWRPEGGGHVGATVELRKGVDIFSASRPGDAGLSRFGADPQALVTRVKFDGETPSAWKLRLAVKAEGQYTTRPLTAPEQYAIGNLTIGRGYDPGAAYGDKAIAVSVELRAGAFPLGGKIKAEPFMFYDAARLWTLTPGAQTRHDIWSWGGGVRLDLQRRVHLELAYAEPRSPPLGLGEPVPSGRVLVNLTVGLNDVFSALRRGGGGAR